MFAYHLSRISKSSDQIHDYLCNALALTAAAISSHWFTHIRVVSSTYDIPLFSQQVECALKMWCSGFYVLPPPCTKEAKFSNWMWGSCVQQYLEGITDLSEQQWIKILAKADKALYGYNINSEDKLDNEQAQEDVLLTGCAGIDDADEVKEESQEMDGIEMTSTADAYATD